MSGVHLPPLVEVVIVMWCLESWWGKLSRVVCQSNGMPAAVAVQVQGREGFPVKYMSVADCAYRIVREEGVASFWRGSMCSFMKVR